MNADIEKLKTEAARVLGQVVDHREREAIVKATRGLVREKFRGGEEPAEVEVLRIELARMEDALGVNREILTAGLPHACSLLAGVVEAKLLCEPKAGDPKPDLNKLANFLEAAAALL